MTATLAEQLAAFAVSTRDDGAPEAVVASVRQRILDVLGLCVAAHRLDTSAAIVEHVRAQGGHEQSTLIGTGARSTASQAALVNGVLAHSLDYDDTHLPSVLHPSASVVPAALAAAEATGADGETLVRAVAAGLEVAVRLGMAGYDPELGNSVFFEHGQHATSITGAMGSAVAVMLIRGGGVADVVNVLGLTASMASGVIEANRTGGTVKRLHCGLAAQAGNVAAELVGRGFTGPPTILEGRFGFFEAWLHGRYRPEEVTRGLGVDWAVPDIFFKPYPANHFTHAVIDAGLALRERGVHPQDIASVEVGVPASVVRTIGEPIERKRRPTTGYQAQFSGPYAVVAGLLGGGGLGVGLDDFSDELARDPERLALMARVSVVADDECTGIFPHQFPAVVTVTTRAGDKLRHAVLTNRGGPQRPLTSHELVTKFDDNLRGRVAPETGAEVARVVLTLGAGDRVADVVASLAPTIAVPATHT